MKKTFGITLAILLFLAVGFFTSRAVADNGCGGHSCDPLPTKSVACDGPAAAKNPHCKPTATQAQPQPTATQQPKVDPTATATPTAVAEHQGTLNVVAGANTGECTVGNCVYVINVNINSLEDLEWLPTAVATLNALGYECWNGNQVQIK